MRVMTFQGLAQMSLVVEGEVRKLMEGRRMGAVQRMEEGRIGLYAISDYPWLNTCILTAHTWTGRFLIAVNIARVFPRLSMGVKPILPLSDLPDLLVAVLVFIVTARP